MYCVSTQQHTMVRSWVIWVSTHIRKEGEKHAWNPETIAKLQIATRLGSYKKYKEYADIVNDKRDTQSSCAIAWTTSVAQRSISLR